jgi:hypothetical protein
VIAFYLGTHQPHWLGLVDFPLMVSHRKLRARATLPRALGPWALDSGAFTEIRDHGRWTITPRAYAAAVRRYVTEVGNLDWAAPMDWMCEPVVIAGGWAGGQRFAGTGLSVAEHQRRTVASVLELRTLAPDLPWIPVLQGYAAVDDYRRCAELYERAGIDLAAEPIVGLGSVCRLQATSKIAHIVGSLADRGIALHGFGVKTLGLGRYTHDLRSADSLAWSYDARRAARKGRPPGHRHPRGGRSCANCLTYATRWRARLLAGLPAHQQLRLPVGGAA